MSETQQEPALEALNARLERLSVSPSEGALVKTTFLSELAVELRSSDVRDFYSKSTLPSSITHILATLGEPLTSGSLAIAEQVGRTAANLAAQCDPGRDVLVDAGYVAECSRILAACVESIDTAISAVKALIASLLNLVIAAHERAVNAVAQPACVETLFDLSETLLKRANRDDELVLEWIWSILDVVLDDHPNPAYIPLITQPFAVYNLSPAAVPLAVMALASDRLDLCANVENVDHLPFTAVTGDSSVLSTMVRFIEDARYVTEEPEEEEGEDGDTAEKAFGKVKGSLINAFMCLCSSVPSSVRTYWNTMRSWLDNAERDDLQSCALLAFGNHARDDSTATALLKEPDSLMPALRRILQPGITAQVLHGAVGLLRNLSIPEANKIILGQEDLLDRFVHLGVWTTEKDMLGSVQGGAVGVVKNICRGNADNASQLAEHPKAIEQILDLLDRTDDPAIRFEATRVFVNCIRSVYSGHTKSGTETDVFEDVRIVSALIRMLGESGPYPVLANESVLGLALLVTFGAAATVTIIKSKLADCIDRVVEILAPKAGEEAATKEVQANTVTLLRQADVRPGGIAFTSWVNALLAVAEREGRQICAAGQGL